MQIQTKMISGIQQILTLRIVVVLLTRPLRNLS